MLNSLDCNAAQCDSPAEKSSRNTLANFRTSEKAMLNTSDTIRSGRSEDGRILLDVHHGQMFSINVVGSQVLDFIEQGWEQSQIAEEIARRYAVSGQTAATDVHVFIEALRKHRIVQAAPCAELVAHK